MAVSNTDDHLRNHGFILTPGGWRLSPLYDVNPIPYGNELSLNVTETDNSISVPLAIKTAGYYGISEPEARQAAGHILHTVGENWVSVARSYKLGKGAIEYMRPAFSACESVKQI